MAIFSSADVGYFLAGGYSILGDLTQLNDEQEALVEETTHLGDSWEQQAYIGVKKWMLTQDGFYNDAALASNVALVVPGTSLIVAYAPEGNTLGAKFIASPTVEAKYNRQMTRGALHKAHAEYMSTGNHDEGKIVATLAARGAASNTQAASLDNGASSAAGMAATLEMSSLTLGGYTNIIVKVQDSPDNASFTDRITFTAITAAPAAERKILAGAVARYLAVAWAYTGSGSGQTATWTVGVARST